MIGRVIAWFVRAIGLVTDDPVFNDYCAWADQRLDEMARDKAH